MSLVIDEHRQYLADRVRLAAFEAAIAEVIRPGDRVLDLASGTGILGLLACRHGASIVYAIDSGSILGLARDISRANGVADRIVAIRGLSTRVELPEPVDLVVSDQIGRFGFDAGLLEYMLDARRRFLRPGGRTIPARLDLCLAPVECPEPWERIEFWRSRPAGFDVSAVHRRALNTGYPVWVAETELLAPPRVLVSIDLAAAGGLLKGEAEFIAARGGVMHGLAGGFIAGLSPGVTITNLPSAASRIQRSNAFFPIEAPATIAAGDRIAVSLRVLPDEGVVRWVVRLAGGRRFAHSTIDGMLLSVEDLHNTRPDAVPVLSPWGRARLSVLELCDGLRTIGNIEHALVARHPELFRSNAQAAAFVSEVVGPYATVSGAAARPAPAR